MKIFRITFRAKKLGSIGATSNYVETVEADDKWGARCKLYKTYEHVAVASIEEIYERTK